MQSVCHHTYEYVLHLERPKANAIQFTVDQIALAKTRKANKPMSDPKKPEGALKVVQKPALKAIPATVELKPQAVEQEQCLMCGS